MPTETQSGPIRRLFQGRIGRLRYFLGYLFSVFLSLGPILFFVVLWGIVRIIQDAGANNSFLLFADILNRLIPILIALSIVIPVFGMHMALAIRRLHDMGYSGWWYLLLWIPYLGIIPGLVLLFKKGQAGANTYGPAPLEGRKFTAEVFNY